MSNKLNKSRGNNENLYPNKRKRLSVHSPILKFAKLECRSLKSMGKFDCEEKSSTATTLNALGLEDSITNETLINAETLNFSDLTNFSNNCITKESHLSTIDNSNIADLKDNEINKFNYDALPTFEFFVDEKSQQQYQQNEKCLDTFCLPPHQRRPVIFDSDNREPQINRHFQMNESTNIRSPLATVTFNSFVSNFPQEEQSQLPPPQIYMLNVLKQKTQSPLNQPSTSEHASLARKNHRQHHQQQYLRNSMYNQQMLSQRQHKQSLLFSRVESPQPTQSNDSFFLFREISKWEREFNSENKDHFNSLSDEMILHIFKWLPKKTLLRCAQVNQRFNRCASDESLWTRLDLGGRTLKPGAMKYILKHGVVVLRLAQTTFKDEIHNPILLKTTPYFESKLQYLDLTMAEMSQSSLLQLLSCCRHLKKLSLEHMVLNDDICQEIAKNVELEALNLTMCYGLEAWSVRKMSAALQELNSLNISWTNLSVDAITSLVTNLTSNIMRLNIAGCRKTLFDSHLNSLAKRCPQLLELDLSDCTGLTGNSIGIIADFKMLEYLSLSRCYLIPASSYIELRNMPSLMYLDIFGMLTDAALRVLEQTFSKININKFYHSSVARPTVGTRRTSIWGLRTRE